MNGVNLSEANRNTSIKIMGFDDSDEHANEYIDDNDPNNVIHHLNEMHSHSHSNSKRRRKNKKLIGRKSHITNDGLLYVYKFDIADAMKVLHNVGIQLFDNKKDAIFFIISYIYFQVYYLLQ